MFNACIIGTGRIASTLEKDPLRPQGSSHAGLYSLQADMQVIAAADISDNALQEFGTDWSISKEHLYSDYTQMLANEPVDIASICAYAPQRLEMATAALDAGAKGLWLEKALGCTIDEAEQIRDAVNAAGATAVVDYPRRARAHYRKIKQIIDENTFGRLQSITCHMTHQLIHTGTHAYDVLRYWCGEAITVRGHLENTPKDPTNVTDQGGRAEIEMSSGTTVYVSAYRKKYYIFQFDLIFDNARILIGNDIAKVYRPETSKLYTGFKELFEQDAFDWGPGHPRDMLSELAHSMKTGEPTLFSIENAIESLRIALAIFHSSSQNGKPISPNEVDSNLRVENT